MGSPNLSETNCSSVQTAYGSLLSNPRFPSDGTLHSPKKGVPAAGRLCVGHLEDGQSVLRASYGIYYGRQNMCLRSDQLRQRGTAVRNIL